MAIIRDRDLIVDINDIPVALIASCIKEHQEGLERLNRLEKYYKGEHAILNRSLSGDEMGLPNNKLVANHAKYITDIAVGYVSGKPVKYEGKQIDEILEVYKEIDIVSHDSEMSKDLSIFGIGLELYFMSSDEVPIPKVTVIDPRQIFLVVDDSVEYRSLFGVHYYEKRDINNALIGYTINVYTQDLIVSYFGSTLTDFEMKDIKNHYFGTVPVVEFWNNEEQQGDFEQQISLIDAYNLLQSDRVNDKEQLVDALLKVKGVSFGDTEEEQTETARMIKKHKILELPEGADADWLIKNLNETEVEVLKDAIKSDIHEFSMVPAMTDENFAANASGVAMKYKLFGLEQLAVTKERYYIQGLRERLKLFANILAIKAKVVDVSDVKITMIRNLPENELTIQEIVSLIGLVSNETLLSILPFVEDTSEEIKKLKRQLEDDLKRTRQEFGYNIDTSKYVNTNETAI